MTDWKQLFEELLRAVEDVRQEIADADITWLAWDAGRQAAKVTTPEDPDSEPYVEPYDVEQPIDDLLEDWRRKLYVAELEAARGAVTA